jgi:hypothetical protein
MAAAPAARVKNQEYRLMCLENDGFFSTGLSQKERSKKKNERNPSDERQREIGEARFVWRCPQSPPPHSACRVLLFPAAQLANTIFLSNKPNRRLFYKKKIDRNLHKFDLWPLAAMKTFFLGCISRNDRFLWDGCPSDWMFMFYLWKAFWWHQMNGMTQPLVAQRINKFLLQKSKGGRMKTPLPPFWNALNI